VDSVRKTKLKRKSYRRKKYALSANVEGDSNRSLLWPTTLLADTKPRSLRKKK